MIIREIRIYVTSWSIVKLLGLPILVEEKINAIVGCVRRLRRGRYMM